LNQGKCVSINLYIAKCLCSSNYTGNICQFNNLCRSNPCLNNGNCISFNNNEYTCQCNSNFTGLLCQINLNLQCTSTFCLNGGTCLTNSMTNLTMCQCAPSYTGSNCQQLFNPCFNTNNNPICLNSGLCTINYLNPPFYTCSCKNGYSGNQCQNKVTNPKFTVTTISILNCIDQNPTTCKYLKLNNLCSDSYSINGQSVKRYCPKSCQLCGTNSTITTSTSSCIDSNSNCPIWSQLNLCSRLPNPYVCKKSCGIC
jgi:hypothetical protein